MSQGPASTLLTFVEVDIIDGKKFWFHVMKNFKGENLSGKSSIFHVITYLPPKGFFHLNLRNYIATIFRNQAKLGHVLVVNFKFRQFSAEFLC